MKATEKNQPAPTVRAEPETKQKPDIVEIEDAVNAVDTLVELLCISADWHRINGLEPVEGKVYGMFKLGDMAVSRLREATNNAGSSVQKGGAK